MAAVSVDAAARPGSTAITCKRGTVAAVVAGKAVCLAVGQKCLLKYQAVYKKKRFVCVAGKLRKLAPPKPLPPPPPPTTTPPPPPQPPPPPPPPATTGHYTGMTSQGSPVILDVPAGGTSVTNLFFGRTSTVGACSASGSAFEGVTTGGIGPITAPVAADGTFTFSSSTDISLSVGGNGIPAKREIGVTGRFSGTTVQGTLKFVVSFVYEGESLRCVGDHTWNATKTG